MKTRKSPLNYTGGKAKLLPQLLPLFPKQIGTFVDLFAGGLNVTLNVDAEHYIANDINHHVIGMYEYFKRTPEAELFAQIEAGIRKYSLSKENEAGFYELRCDYNRTHTPLLLFLLVCYGFNHQIRYNNDGEFNNPFGKERSCFNKNTARNLHDMMQMLPKVDFKTVNFKEFEVSDLKQGDFVYADPPYLISCGAYNDGKRGFEGWSPDDDKALFELLDKLDDRGVKFALSNVFHHKDETNYGLIEWAKRYSVHHLSMDYNNANYQSKTSFTDEVLVINY